MHRLVLVCILLSLSYLAEAQVDAGSIGNNQQVCYGSAAIALTCTPSGGIEPYIYHWEISTDGGSSWTSILTRTNQAVYSPPILAKTSQFRVRVTDGNSGEDYSNVVVITVLASLTAGTIGDGQTICPGSTAEILVEKEPASGGTGSFSYQWQSSTDSLIWSDISGAVNSTFTPTGLNSDTWFKRLVVDPSCGTTGSNVVRINVNSLAIKAQLHDDLTIDNNSAANFNIIISGGSSLYTVNYTLNGIPQSPINGYSSGENISTGLLNSGSYIYALTSINSDRCSARAQNLGIPLTISVGPTNKALVIVNSGSGYFEDYNIYIKPYLKNFGIPFDEYDISSKSLPGLNNYGVIIFGHRQVYSSGSYPNSELGVAISSGIGLYSFDPVLFEDPSPFSFTLPMPQSGTSNQVDIITSPASYITQLHINDGFDDSDGTPNNNPVTLRTNWTIEQTSHLNNGSNLATIGSVPLLESAGYGNGRIVKWTGYDWIKENILGPVAGMDDLIWRGIVWAARKPFAMQGMPPFVTLRVDDVAGNGNAYGGGAGNIIDNFLWINICHDYGIIPWCGTFNGWIRTNQLPTFKALLDAGYATASPHAEGDHFIFFDHQNELFNVAQTTQNALNFYQTHGLPLSKFFVPHWYELNSEALPVIRNAGGQFLGIRIPPDNWQQPPLTSRGELVTPSINGGPYRINRNGYFFDDETRGLYFGGEVNLNGLNFFLCFTEINDDGYDWSPSSIDGAVSRGIRQLRRCFNSMVLGTLVTHEYFFPWMTETSLRSILNQIRTTIDLYKPALSESEILYPEYNISMDQAIEYIKARNNIQITNVAEDASNYYVTYSGNNQMDTRCFLFTEQDGVIYYRFVALPQITFGCNTVSSPK